MTAVGLAVERMEGVLQVGIVDIDDVILNACGVIIGFGNIRGRGSRAIGPHGFGNSGRFPKPHLPSDLAAELPADRPTR